MLVVACNTATAAAVRALRENHPGLPIVGVEPGVKPAAAASVSRHIAVLATESTANSERLARLIAEHAAELQSLDSVALGEALERRLDALGRTLPVLVQVNTSGEAAKAGFRPEDTPAAVATLRACPHLEVRGLMTMAAHTTDRDAIRSSFACLRDLRDRLRDVYGPELGALSMGMSGDFELAVEEGATCVRLGSVIFGTRPAQA